MMVPHTGVWKRGFTLAQMPGMALWADMDSVVRAPGRIVVSVEAVADVSTTAMSTPTARAMIHHMEASLPMARMMPPTPMIGA